MFFFVVLGMVIMYGVLVKIDGDGNLVMFFICIDLVLFDGWNFVMM